ncbi:MAG: hypothetical protein IPF75_05405 [Bacteroidetes bacterium]|nr:hypothetical protein [Bacteroidota bacterium]
MFSSYLNITLHNNYFNAFQQLVVISRADNLGTSIVPDSTVQTDTLKLNVNDSTVFMVDSLQSDTTLCNLSRCY